MNSLFRFGGSNNNPSARVLKSAFRAILMRAGCEPGNRGNIIPLDDTSVPEPLTEEDLGDSRYELDANLSEFSENVLYYIAGFIIKKTREMRNFCDTCSEALMDFTFNGPNVLVKERDCGPLYYASHDLLKLLRRAEKLLHTKLAYQSIISSMLENFSGGSALFSSYSFHFSSEVHFLSSHYYSLIKFCAETYLTLRMKSIAKNRNCDMHKKFLRQKLNKVVLFANQ